MKIEKGTIHVDNEDLKHWQSRLAIAILDTGKWILIAMAIIWMMWGICFLVYGVEETMGDKPFEISKFWAWLVFPAKIVVDFCIMTYSYHKHKNN